MKAGRGKDKKYKRKHSRSNKKYKKLLNRMQFLKNREKSK